MDPGGVFTGVVDGGTGASVLELARGNGKQGTLGVGATFVRFGSVVEDAQASWAIAGQQTFAGGITMASGATLAVEAGAQLSAPNGYAVYANAGPEVVDNSGAIMGTGTAGVGVNLTAGGTITNQASGTISGTFAGIEMTGTIAGAAINYGLISGGNLYAADITGAAQTLTNFGTIETSTTAGKAVFLSGGTLNNEAGATISGVTDGVQAYGSTAATVINAGLISGSRDVGVFLQLQAHSLSNSGTIQGGQYGSTSPPRRLLPTRPRA